MNKIMESKSSTFERELSIMKVRVGIVEKRFEDFVTKQQVIEQLLALQ